MFSQLIEPFQMRKNLNMSQESLDDLRLMLFKKLLGEAFEYVPFYKNLNFRVENFQGLSDLNKLPIVTKKDIRRDCSQFLSTKVEKNRLHRSFSSGSTGEPTAAYYERHYWIRKKYFSKLRARMTCGMRFGERVAIFEPESPEKINRKNQLFFYSHGLFRIRYFSMFECFDKTATELIVFNPHSIYAMPGFLFQFSKYLGNAQFTCLKRIFTASEYLDANMRIFLTEKFQTEIFDHYGCNEVKEVAWECEKHEGYHINEDELIIEVLNGSEPVGFGEVGDIVITDLRNQIMPFIRYRIHDKGMLLSQKCSCGRSFSLMQPVAGRASEYVQLPDGDKLSPYQFTTAIEKIEGILQYQFIQINEKELQIKLVMDSPNRKIEMKEIKSRIKSVTRQTMAVQTDLCEEIALEANGKFKVVKNNLVNKRGGM